MTQLDERLRTLRVLQIVFLGSIILYAGLGEVLNGAEDGSIDQLLRNVITFVAGSSVVFLAVLRRNLLASANDRLRTNPDDTEAIQKWYAGNFVTLVFGETISLFGLVLRFLGAELAYAGVFYAAGAVVIIILSPRKPGA